MKSKLFATGGHGKPPPDEPAKAPDPDTAKGAATPVKNPAPAAE